MRKPDREHEAALMLIRKFDRAQLDSEPHSVLFKDLYPWDAIHETPFGASLALIEPGGQTMIHNHNPAETFIICQGKGTMSINGETAAVATGDVIYLPPDSVHNLRNDSAEESLMFLSVFWDTSETAEQPASAGQVAAPRLFMPSPPTPNGPFHMGHLAGPYLVADVLRRYDQLNGRPSKFILLSDDHQTYVPLRASYDEATPAETVKRYGQEQAKLLQDLNAAPDLHIHPSQDGNFQKAVQQAFSQLPLEVREGDALYCEDCQHYLFEAKVSGECPHCGEECRGFICEDCCLPNHTVDLGNPQCLECEKAAVRKPLKQLFFDLNPYLDGLADYHAELRLSPRLRVLAQRMLDLEDPVFPVSHPSDWGTAVPQSGFEGQTISPWLEVALAGLSGATHFFGYDNAFLYLIQDPAVSLALKRPLAQALSPNDFLLLEEGKMSTSSQHNVDARSVLDQVPCDVLRLFLAGVRPEQTEVACDVAQIERFANQVVQGPWQSWLEQLGRALVQESGSKAPGSDDWAEEQQEFYEFLEETRDRVSRAFDNLSLREASRGLQELVDRAWTFHQQQSALVGTDERPASLVLELAAARLLAQLSAPLMPNFAATLWKHLGQRQPLSWPQRVQLVDPGQRILAAAGLSSRSYFPAPRQPAKV